MARLALFHPSGAFSLRTNPFGKDVANIQLFQALARHGGYEQVDILSLKPTIDEALRAEIFEDGQGETRVVAGSPLNTRTCAEAGALLRGQPYLSELAWLRRRGVGDRGYSLLGLVHTIAPPAVREMIAGNVLAPVHPWDAIICTSPAVQDGVKAMMEAYGAHLAERTGGRAPPQPMLPLVPLGVDGPAFAAIADRPDARARVRKAMGLREADVLVLWVGRLSYFEKAFPQPMFQAVQQAKTETGARVAFALAGWFPAPGDRDAYAQAARVLAPGVDVRFEDGNDRARVNDLWAAADIFISLVDNVQETFGITPLEAMAAGLPVVASDWDGYRFTVRDGEEGFLIPTLAGPAEAGLGGTLAARHMLGLDSYQTYAGATAQHTAVHVGRCAAALAELIRSPELRRRMGAAGRERIRTAFDWPVVARQVRALTDELAAIRAAGPELPPNAASHPARGEPFADFQHFATAALSLETRLTAAPGASGEAVRTMAGLTLGRAYQPLRASTDGCVRALELVAARPGVTVREVLLDFPMAERRALQMGLAWMAKYGFLDWLD